MEWSFWLVLLMLVAIAFLPAAFLILRPSPWPEERGWLAETPERQPSEPAASVCEATEVVATACPDERDETAGRR